METLDLAAPLAAGLDRYKAILRLALPTVFAMLSQSIVNEIDVVYFSHLPCPESSNGQAALLPSLILVWLFGGSLSAISVGTQALVARRYAEGDRQAAGAVLANGTFFCVVAGGIFSAIGLMCLPWLVRSMVAVPEVREVAIDYTRWRMLGVISMSATMAIKAFFDGIGKTHVHLVAALVMNVANVVFCWAFIFGHLGSPRMGAPGAGLGAFVATWIGLAIMVLTRRSCGGSSGRSAGATCRPS
jgi:Na+-driven multidrug efflux pump